MSLMMTDTQKVLLTVNPVDSRGNPAPVEGPPEWSLSDRSLADLAVSSDGLSATLVAAGPVGNLQVNVSADADLGAGTQQISGMLEVEIVAGQATSLTIGAGEPEPA